jgi:uncharacterized repeat protein (TIGR01451 family)
MGKAIGSMGAIVVLFVLHMSAAFAQVDVDIEKFTNGQDADAPLGPVLLVGDPISWTYVVTNTGSRELVNISVTDDQGETVTCPQTTLDAGASMICTADGTATVGQYANVGTVEAERPDTTIASDSDPSHYFGQTQLAITLEKSTNGVDADAAPGPVLAVGDAVDWTYEVTNIGAEAITDIAVEDDQGVVVTCPGTTLVSGASMICTGAGTVQPGQYANIGFVTAILPSEVEVAASDPSHYFGQTLLLETATNGQDADTPPGPLLPVGATVNWTYEVTNPGPETVTGLSVTDDQGVTVSCAGTTLGSGESMTCTASGVAAVGQYANIGTATAQLPLGGSVLASDPSHYFGTTLVLEKATNGQDADVAPGPVVAVGSAIDWTYVITNNGAEAITDIAVEDDQGVVVTCPPGTTLASGESMTCTGNGTAIAGQYTNTGTVLAEHPTLGQIGASDLSHYFGQDQILDFGDAPAPYPTTLADNGARHLLGGDAYLGACVDSELDGQSSAAADGDDGAVGTSTFGTCAVAGGDGDGVVFTTALIAGNEAAVDVVANNACTLSAWIDFNQDGDWGDSGEGVFPGGTVLAPGSNPLTFAVPSTALVGQTAARFRCTTDGAVSPAGEVSDGEVEDYIVDVQAPSIDIAASKTGMVNIDQNGDGLAGPGDTLAYTIIVTNGGNVALTDVVVNDTPDSNADLQAGSVVTTQGSVTTGNTAGDTSVSVDIGTLAAGDAVTISFLVTMPDPRRGSATEIVNQATVSGSNFADVLTDAPNRAGDADPTVIAAEASAVVEIPTLGGWGLLLLAALLALVTVAVRWRGAGRAGR